MIIHHRPETLQVSGSVDCDFRNQYGPIQNNRGRQLKDLDWTVLWRDQLEMVCWDVQDACVFWWESFSVFSLFLFFSSSKMCGNVLQASRPSGEPFCWNFAEVFCCVFVFFPPQDTQHLCFSLLFFLSCFSSVVLQRKRLIFLSNLATFLVWLTKSYFHFPLCQVPVQSG